MRSNDDRDWPNCADGHDRLYGGEGNDGLWGYRRLRACLGTRSGLASEDGVCPCTLAHRRGEALEPAPIARDPSVPPTPEDPAE
jgi:hypothetical protein